MLTSILYEEALKMVANHAPRYGRSDHVKCCGLFMA